MLVKVKKKILSLTVFHITMQQVKEKLILIKKETDSASDHIYRLMIVQNQ